MLITVYKCFSFLFCARNPFSNSLCLWEIPADEAACGVGGRGAVANARASEAASLTAD